MGTLNIIDWCTENGNPPLVWSEHAGSVFVTFLPAALPAAQRGTEQVTEQVMRVLNVLGKDTISSQELMERVGLSHRPTFLYSYLQPALYVGLIEMTIPDKPRSSKQKYMLTDKGRKTLSNS